MTQDTSPDKAFVVMAGSILQISVMVIRNKFSVLGLDTQEERLRGSGKFLLEIAISVMDVKMHGLCVDAAITGIMTSPLAELQYLDSAAFIVGQSSQTYCCAVNIGDVVVILAFRSTFGR
ncbi:hypothetical protein SLEP1_g41700 [Rubroshorea leprosula]|uniref:Uncharacterized protein n=1 Tax=Rubroshorea leprosula TaxID=152421 RepID=A0AAV5L7W3_9ROSI|nr:hypothetical protein SLEP1_g41700 [Rubroshorea leprosula]